LPKHEPTVAPKGLPVRAAGAAPVVLFSVRGRVVHILYAGRSKLRPYKGYETMDAVVALI